MSCGSIRIGAFEAKIRLEREDPTGRTCSTRPREEPDYEDDWLLDIRLYSRSSAPTAPRSSCEELGLANQALRAHIDERKKFFDNKERFKKLQALVSPQDTELDLDRKMLAVLVRADQPDLFTIVLALFHSLAGFPVSGVSYTQVRSKPGVLREGDGLGEPEDELLLHDKGEPDLGTPPPAWDMVAKLGLDGAFWHMVKTTFGYAKDTPTLRNLLIRLLLTDYAHHLNGGLPTSLQHLVLPPNTRQNVVACLSHWRDSASRGSSYDRLSEMVADILKLDSHLDSLDIDILVNVMTFLPVEKAIARSLRDRVRHTADSVNAEDIRKIAQRRQDGHWASLGVTGLPTVPRKALHAVYDALVAAADFFALRNQYRGRFDFTDAKAMYHAYEKELYQFDQLYRHFCETADLAEAEGWGVLKPLRQELEACYGTWFVTTAALTWGKFVDPAHGQSLLKNWRIEKVPDQHGVLCQNGAATPGQGRRAQGLCHHQRCLPLRGSSRADPRAEREIPIRGGPGLAARRAALLHRPGHGQPAPAPDAGVQAHWRSPGGWQTGVLAAQRRRHPGGGDGVAVKGEELWL